jgi:hypothetical protein
MFTNYLLTDIEYYFLQLRAKSVGEIVEFRYRCNNVVEGKECGNIMENNLDITRYKLMYQKILVQK